MSERIKIGVIGTANIAVRSIIPELLKLNEKYELGGIASRSLAKASIVANQFQIEAFDSYEKLIKSKKIDAVYIPLPNALHYNWVKKSMQEGLHVIVEKSMACTYKEVLELNEFAKKNNLVLLENFQFRFHEQMKKIKVWLNKNLIGELRCIRSSFGFPPFVDNSNIRYSNKLGGGALLDAGAYPIKISQIILGNNLNVDSANLYFDKEKKVDLWGSASLSLPGNSISSQISWGFDNSYQCHLEIWGSNGTIKASRIFTAKPDFYAEISLDFSNGESKKLVFKDNHFKNMLEYFYDLVKKNVDGNEYDDNLSQSRIIEHIYNKKNK